MGQGLRGRRVRVEEDGGAEGVVVDQVAQRGGSILLLVETDDGALHEVRAVHCRTLSREPAERIPRRAFDRLIAEAVRVASAWEEKRAISGTDLEALRVAVLGVRNGIRARSGKPPLSEDAR